MEMHCGVGGDNSGPRMSPTTPVSRLHHSLAAS